MAAIRPSAVNCAFPSWKATHMEMQWWIWLVFGVALILLELVLPTFFILWFGIGAVLVALIALIAPSLQLDSQVVLWVLFAKDTATTTSSSPHTAVVEVKGEIAAGADASALTDRQAEQRHDDHVQPGDKT